MFGKNIIVFERVIRSSSSILNNASAILVFLIMLQGTVDMIGRYVFNKPLSGTWEMTVAWLPLVVFFSWGYTQFVKGHVTVDMIVTRFPPRMRAIVDVVTSFLTLSIIGLIVWQGAINATYTMERGRYIPVVNWPLAPFQYMVCLGAFVFGLVLILDIVKLLITIKNLSGGNKQSLTAKH